MRKVIIIEEEQGLEDSSFWDKNLVLFQSGNYTPAFYHVLPPARSNYGGDSGWGDSGFVHDKPKETWGRKARGSDYVEMPGYRWDNLLICKNEQ